MKKDLPREMIEMDPAYCDGGSVKMAAEGNESFRKAHERRDNPWCMEIPPTMPLPAMDGQSLIWGENICGLWSYRRYFAINGKWVDTDPTKVSYHPLGGKKFV